MRFLHLGSYLYGANDIVNIMQRSLQKIPTIQLISLDMLLYGGQPSPFIRPEASVNWIKDGALQAWIAQYLPDAIICNAGGLSPSPQMHDQLMRMGIRRIGIALSDPDDFEPRSRHFAHYFDVFFTNAHAILPRYQALGVDAKHLAFAADPNVHRPLAEAKLHDVVIVGEKRPDRVELVQMLRDHRLNVMCYGKNWAFPSTEVSGESQVRAINSGYVYLSFAGTLAGYINVKVGVFEAAACGTCILVQDFPEIHNYFEADQEIVTFVSADDAVEKARYLRANPERAAAIGQAARERVLKDHTWVDRWHQVLDYEYRLWGSQRTNAVIQRRIDLSAASMKTASLLSPRSGANSGVLNMRVDLKYVLIAGYYGFENTGDEAILITILDGLKYQYPNLMPIVVAGNPQLTRQNYDVEAIYYLDVEAVIAAAQRCDLIILGGGGLFMDYWGIDTDTLLTRYQHGLSFYASFPLLATLLNKPCMIYAVGAGPFFSRDARAITRTAFEQAQITTVRDVGTYQLLSSIGVPEKRLQVTADPAFLLQAADPAQVARIRRSERIPDTPSLTLGVCVRWWSRGIQPEDWWSEMASALDRFSDLYNATIVFIPFQTLEEAGIENDDRLVAQRIQAQMRFPERTFVMQRKYTPAETLGLIASCDLLLGMRLHSIIFAALAHVPFVALAYDPKVGNITADLDTQEFTQALEQITADSLFEKLQAAYSQRAEVRQALAARVPQVKERAAENIRLALGLLQAEPQVSIPLPPQSTEFIKARFLAQARRLEQQEQQIEYLREQAASQGKLESQLLAQMQTLITTHGGLEAQHLTQIRTLIPQLDGSSYSLNPQDSALFQEYTEKLAQVEVEKEQMWMRLNEVTSTKVWRLALRYWRVRDAGKFILRKFASPFLAFGRNVYHRAVPVQTRLKFKDNRQHILHRDTSDAQSSEPEPPLPPGKKFDVFCFPIITWDFRFQRPQQLLTQFANDGHRVFYLHTELSNDAKVAIRPIQENIYELRVPGKSRLILYRDVFKGEALKRAMNGMNRFVNDQNIQQALCIVHHPFWEPLATFLKQEYGWKVIYDCMDDHAGFPDNRPATLAYEDILIAHSDLLVVSSQVLYDKFHTQHSKTLLVRNAGDYEHFRHVVDKAPQEVASLPHPIIGYYGAIAEWFDADAVALAARRHPDWSFVLIGHTFGASLDDLKKYPNVHLLDEKPYAQLPAYLSAMDVCTIPFKRIPLTEATNPVKIYEYLSAGKAVVARRLPETELFADTVYLYEDAQSFVTGLETMLVRPSPEVIAARKVLAQRNTWLTRYHDLYKAILDLYGRVSIIMVTFKNAHYTRLALESIFDKTIYPNYEIVVIDNGLDADVLQVLFDIQQRHSEKIKIKLPGRNLGFAKANNLGIAEAEDSEYIVLLNDDVVVTYGWLSSFVRYLRDPQIGIIGPVTNSAGNEARIDVGYASDLHDLDEFARRQIQKYRGQSSSIRMLAMYCVALRKATMEQIGALDERFGIGMFEDDDYAERLKQAGYKIEYANDVFIHHFGSSSFSKLKGPNYFRIFERNRARYEEKWHRRWPNEILIPPEISSGQVTPVDQLQQVVDSHLEARGVIVFLPNIGWKTTLFQRPQQMALQFAQHGYLVFFLLEESHDEGILGIHEVTERLYLCKCPSLTFNILESVVAIVYTYNVNLLSSLVAPTIIYEQIDRLEVFSSFPRDMLQQQHDLMVHTADVVIGTADRLVEDLHRSRPDALLVPNGVDYAHFAPHSEEVSVPEDICPYLGRPIIGYYGALAEWLDFELIEYAARQLPDFTFILIGPDLDEYAASERSFSQTVYKRMPENVHWLGPKAYEVLPQYLRAFDVATIPFRVNEVTHAVSPLKLFEYMAGEKPIVTTDFEEGAKYEGVLAAKSYDDYVSKLEHALTLRDDQTYRATLKRVAQANTWDARAESIIQALEHLKVAPQQS